MNYHRKPHVPLSSGVFPLHPFPARPGCNLRWLGVLCLVLSLGLVRPLQAANIAPEGTAIMGVNDAVDGDAGTPRFNAGVLANINDEDTATRVDNWFGGNTDTVSFVGVLWPSKRYDPIVGLDLTLATFVDGGWFGAPGESPGAGGALTPAMLVAPTVQVTSDGGATWTTVDSDSDYLFNLDGHTIGGGANPNPTSVSSPFFLFEPITRIDGIRLIATNGGNAGPDANGFLGVFELVIESIAFTDTDGDGLPDEWEEDNGLTVGVNDGGDDSDTDGLNNLGEYNAGSNPQVADTDGDGLDDGDEVNTHMTSPLLADTDADGLTDGDEVNTHGSNPLLADSDNDTLTDGEEVNTYGTNPNMADTDEDGFPDPFEIAQGTDPTDPDSFPNNFALTGTPILGTASADRTQEAPVFNAGVAGNINDGNVLTRVDSFSGSAHTNSFVGIVWDEPLEDTVQRLEFTLATFFDGGWFGRNGIGPGAGGFLSAATYLLEPEVQVSLDGGATWNVVGHTSDYLTELDGHPLPAVNFGPPTAPTATFTLNEPQTGITGIRILGSEGGTVGGGFLGVFELAVRGEALDADNDGMEDAWERMNGLIVGVDDSGEDPDMDGLPNLEEFENETNPQLADTDGDGLDDGDELATHNTDPLDSDSDGDGLSDGSEVNDLGTSPLLADTDDDGAADGEEVELGTDPNNPISYPVNLARLGTGLLGTKVALDSGAETPLFHSGSAASIVDGNFATRVDTWNGDQPTVADTVSFVGVRWVNPLTEPLNTLRLRFATFVDGGWFGANGLQPAAGGPLENAHVVEPRIEITTDGGTTWTTAPHTSDYFSTAVGHLIGGGGQPNPSAFTSTFTLDEPAVGINGIRIIGTEGGAASGGFLGVFELQAVIFSEDTDNDGLEDSWERSNGLTVGVDDSGEDPDMDGLTNAEEFDADTHPQMADTDGDGLNDGPELNTHNTDPLVADTDADGLSDGAEVNDYGSNPLEVDSDMDGFRDGYEVANGSDPANADSIPPNVAIVGTGILGTKPTLDTGTETPRFNAGTAANINDGNLDTRVDNWNGNIASATDTVSFVGVVWPEPLEVPVGSLNFTMATFVDGGWFGVNNLAPGAGGALTLDHLVAPRVEITTDGGATWTPVGSTTDYLTAVNGHLIGGGGQPNPSKVSSSFTLDAPASGITGIRLIGTEGGTASGGFLGVFELEVLILDSDSDGDGMDDSWERMNGLTVGIDDSAEDPDMDDLTNLEEFDADTNPQLADTDGDGLNDGPELNDHGTDPLVADSDGDGLNDGDEVMTHGTDPLVVDSDNDGAYDGSEVAIGSDPNNALSYPVNVARQGTGLLGTKVALDSGAETPLFHGGSAANIVDGNDNSRVDTWNGDQPTVADTVSFVGVSWADAVNEPIVGLRLRLATFGDGGWFGVNNASPGAGQPLAPSHLAEPRVEITTDGGATWTEAGSTSDYLSVAEGHRIGGGGQPNPSAFATVFLLDSAATGINGMRLIGTEGGLASGGFLGVFEFEAFILASDEDNDGLEDSWERMNGLNVGVDDSGEDPDSDGLTNLEEFENDTLPQVADTDGDGLNDGSELNDHGTNPLVADSDADGLSDGDEVNTYGSNPLVVDTDEDGFRDGYEVANGSSPTNPNSIPANIAIIGTGILGTKPTLDTGVETPRFNSGTAANINDGNPNTRVDNWNGNIASAPDTVSFVGVVWPEPLEVGVTSLNFTMATFGDGGWFGVNNLSPAPGGALTSDHLAAPRVEISTDGGATWTPVGSTTDYLTAVEGHLIGGGGQPNPTKVSSSFTLDSPATGITGIRLIGTEGGVASGGFLGVFELEVLREVTGALDAMDDLATTPEDTAITIPVLANDTAPGGSSPMLSDVGPAGFGTAAANSDGTVTYTPNANFFGSDSFTYSITDGSGETDSATVSINVTSVNDAPMPVIHIDPSTDLGPTVAGLIVISPNGETACATLDGSASTDADNDAGDLTYLWLIDEVPVGAEPVIDACLLVGGRTVTLLVDDGTDMGMATVTVEVLTPGEAVEELVMIVEESIVVRSNKQPFLASLKATIASFDRGNWTSALNQLGNAFQNKVRAQIGKDNPELAEEWNRIAQEITDAVLRPQECDCEE